MANTRSSSSGSWHAGHYVLVCGACIFTSIVARSTPFATQLERYWARSVELAVRAAAKREPPLEDRIKIFTAPAPSDKEPAQKVTAAMLAALLAQQPRLLFVDHELLDGTGALSLPGAQSGPTGTTLITTGFLARESGSDLAARLVPPTKLLDLAKLDSFTGFIDKDERLYGPMPETQGPFARIGFLDYEEYGYFEPAHKLGDGRVALHASLLGGDNVVFYQSSIEIDGGDLHPSFDHRVPIDVPNRRALASRTKSLAELASLTTAPDGLKGIVRKGDAVILAVARPLGVTHLPVPISRDQAIAAGINSHLRKSWMRETPAPWFLLAVAGLLGALVASSTTGGRRTASVIAVGLGWAVLGIVAFSLRGICMPWLFAGLTVWSTGAAVAFMHRYERLRRSLHLAEAVAGKVSPAVAADFASRVKTLGAAQPRLVTFLSVDTRIMPLEEGANAFQSVHERGRAIVQEIRDLLWGHGAVIHSAHDEHMLAFFGATVDGEAAEDKHPEAALACAVAIQKRLLDATLTGKDTGAFAAIGIETAIAMVGVLDPAKPLELGVASDAIGLAGQLRIGCNRYRLMLGPKVAHLLPAARLEGYPQQIRLAKLASGMDLSECRELNPFTTAAEAERLSEAERRCNAATRYVRQDMRWPVPAPGSVLCEVDGSRGSLLNYSSSGLMVRLDKYFASRTLVTLVMRSQDGALEQLLGPRGLDSFRAEVRWAQEDREGGFAHGLRLDDQLNPGQRELLVGILTDYLHEIAKRTGVRGA